MYSLLNSYLSDSEGESSVEGQDATEGRTDCGTHADSIQEVARVVKGRKTEETEVGGGERRGEPSDAGSNLPGPGVLGDKYNEQAFGDAASSGSSSAALDPLKGQEQKSTKNKSKGAKNKSLREFHRASGENLKTLDVSDWRRPGQEAGIRGSTPNAKSASGVGELRQSVNQKRKHQITWLLNEARQLRAKYDAA
ncbi:Mitotic checkpoint regulator MAD2B-interacting family protein [Cryptosporidium felis]|nr:Mitotic checkpoint regulator MAD2B-interacting family protein [Cryptosporidium felis]